jgi:hypothetical protein
MLSVCINSILVCSLITVINNKEIPNELTGEKSDIGNDVGLPLPLIILAQALDGIQMLRRYIRE